MTMTLINSCRVMAPGLQKVQQQADVKIAGIDYQVIKESVEAGMEANSHILDIMDRCISSPRASKVRQWGSVGSVRSQE